MTTPNDELPLDDIKTVRAQLILSTLAIGLMGLALFLGYELTRPPDPQSGRACTAESEVEVCEPDESCVDGTCRLGPDRQQQVRCQENDPCDTCTCDGKFACEEGLCRPLENDVCSDAVLKVLQATLRFERTQCRSANGKGAATCEAKDLEKFFMEYKDFNELMLGFEHGGTIHFADGQPAEGHLSAASEASYTHSLATMKDRLLGAKHILVIGRASNDSGRNLSLNYSLAQLRMIEVQRLLTALPATAQGRDEMAKKLITLAIGTTSPLTPELLLEREYHHYITWSDRSTRRLREAVNGHAKLSQSARSTLHRQLNQSVLIVPVTCEIPDVPPPAEAQP